MKKNLFLFSLLFSMLLILTGCGNKKVITTDKFIDITEKNGFVTKDILDQFSNTDVLDATIANYNSDFQLEFYVLDSTEGAKEMFLNNKNIFETYKGSVSKYSSTDIGNSSTYMLESSGYYMYLSRVDNTLLYVKVDDIYKERVKSIIKELGY